MESINFLSYAKKQGFTGETLPLVKRSKGNSLFITFMTNRVHTEGEHKGKPVVESIWIARTVADSGKIKEGDKVADLGLQDMILVQTENAQGESRLKLAYAGESSYVSAFEI